MDELQKLRDRINYVHSKKKVRTEHHIKRNKECKCKEGDIVMYNNNECIIIGSNKGNGHNHILKELSSGVVHMVCICRDLM